MAHALLCRASVRRHVTLSSYRALSLCYTAADLILGVKYSLASFLLFFPPISVAHSWESVYVHAVVISCFSVWFIWFYIPATNLAAYDHLTDFKKSEKSESRSTCPNFGQLGTPHTPKPSTPRLFTSIINKFICSPLVGTNSVKNSNCIAIKLNPRLFFLVKTKLTISWFR